MEKNENNEFTAFIPNVERANGERKKYFSFGLSLIDNADNAERITAISAKIERIRKLTGTSGLSNVDFIETLINYADAKLRE